MTQNVHRWFVLFLSSIVTEIDKKVNGSSGRFYNEFKSCEGVFVKGY